MFSTEEKQKISTVIEDTLLALDHPEMPKDAPVFLLTVMGKESWSYAQIGPNHEHQVTTGNPWNEIAREVMK